MEPEDERQCEEGLQLGNRLKELDQLLLSGG
jgi:hypothetical protein